MLPVLTGDAPTNVSATVTAPPSPAIGDTYMIVTQIGDSPGAAPPFQNTYTGSAKIIANTSQTINGVNTTIVLDERQSATIKYKNVHLICVDTNTWAMTVSDVGPVA